MRSADIVRPMDHTIVATAMRWKVRDKRPYTFGYPLKIKSLFANSEQAERLARCVI